MFKEYNYDQDFVLFFDKTSNNAISLDNRLFF